MRSSLLHVALATLAAVPVQLGAQVRASEHGTVSQQVSTTTLTLEYDRPVARGRNLFGDGAVVKWGETWTPGANWATTFETTRDVRIEGQPLPKGRYSLWLVPQVPPASWSLVFAKTARRFHTRRPRADDEQLRVPVKPEQGMHMETLAWYFPVVTPDGTTLRMHWGSTYVPVQIGVDLPAQAALPAEERALYPGTYRMRVAPDAGQPFDVDLVVRDANGTLKIRTTPRDLFGHEVDLVPLGERRFHVTDPSPGKFRGQSYTEPGMVIQFDDASGHAAAVQVLGYDGTVMARGTLAKR
jgi:hypothetical protein